VSPKFLIPDPVGDAELASIVAELATLNGTAASQLGTELAQTVLQGKIWNDAIAQGLPIPGWVWGRIVSDLPVLGKTAQWGDSLAWSLPNLEGTFGARFPGWTVTGKNWVNQFKSWVNTALNTAQGAAGVLSKRYDQMVMDLPSFTSLQNFVAGATGRDAALEAGNQVNLWTAEQIEQMNATLAAQAASEQAYYGYQLQRDAAAQANLDAFFTFVPYDGSGKSYGCCAPGH
jgi:P-type conjugative transfer protein TrbJ